MAEEEETVDYEGSLAPESPPAAVASSLATGQFEDMNEEEISVDDDEGYEGAEGSSAYIEVEIDDESDEEVSVEEEVMDEEEMVEEEIVDDDEMVEEEIVEEEIEETTTQETEEEVHEEEEIEEQEVQEEVEEQPETVEEQQEAEPGKEAEAEAIVQKEDEIEDEFKPDDSERSAPPATEHEEEPPSLGQSLAPSVDSVVNEASESQESVARTAPAIPAVAPMSNDATSDPSVNEASESQESVARTAPVIPAVAPMTAEATSDPSVNETSESQESVARTSPAIPVVVPVTAAAASEPTPQPSMVPTASGVVRAPPPPVIVSSMYEDEDPTDEMGGSGRGSENPAEAFIPTLTTIGSADEDDIPVSQPVEGSTSHEPESESHEPGSESHEGSSAYEEVTESDTAGEDVVDIVEGSEASVSNSESIVKGSFAAAVAAPDDDIEKGLNREAAPSQDGKVFLDSEEQQQDGFFSNRIYRILCCLVLMLIILGIILAVVLTRDNDDKDRSGPIITLVPTVSPTTMSPTPFYIVPTLAASFNRPASWAFGASVGITRTSRSYIAVGAPGAPNAGAVILLRNTTGKWEEVQALSNNEDGSRFGASLSFSSDTQTAGMIVGAPNALASGTNTPAGAAYYYEYDRANDRWSSLGSPIQGGLNQTNADEQFGESVSASNVNRVAIGAPGHNAGSADSGRVYVYEYRQNSEGFEWTEMSDTVLAGSVPAGRFGSAVAISPDGNLLAAASSLNSIFIVYEWKNNDWEMIFVESAPGGNLNEEFGSSITFLSNTHIAVGGPGAFNEAGVVRVYEKPRVGFFEQLGPDITGENGERIGAGQMSGLISDNGRPSVAVGTNSGLVRRFTYNPSLGEWVERYVAADTGNGGATSSVSMITDGPSSTTVAGVGSGSSIFIFNAALEGTSPMSMVPTLSPKTEDTESPIDSTQPPPTSSTTVGATDPPVSSPIDSTQPPPTSSTTVGATDPPVSSPLLGSWEFVASPPTGSASIDSGSTVSLTENSMAFGAPLFNGGGGLVQPFERSGRSFSSLPSIMGSGKFGSSIDAISTSTVTAIFVGAPEATDTQGFGVSLGSASYYRLEGGVYTLVGNAIEPDGTPGSVNGRFGTSVAAARDVSRVVVGAPRFSSSTNARFGGRVYMYEFDGTEWMPLGNSVQIGSSGGSGLGTDVSMSNDGNRVLAGAPGNGGGEAIMYEYSNGEWQSIFSKAGQSSTELFGTSVAIISDSGDTIAVGAPGFAGTRGAVRIYRREAGVSSFIQLGNDIVGEPGQQLGKRNSLSGSEGKLVLGTATAELVQFAYNEAVGDWAHSSIPENVDGISSVDTTGDASFAVVGDTTRANVTVYALQD